MLRLCADVVQLARDPGALVSDGLTGPHLSLLLEACGSSLELSGLLGTPVHGSGQHPCGRDDGADEHEVPCPHSVLDRDEHADQHHAEQPAGD